MFILVQLELLVEGKQAGGEIGELQILEGARQVEYTVVFSVAVFVEIAVGIIKQDSLDICLLYTSDAADDC